MSIRESEVAGGAGTAASPRAEERPRVRAVPLSEASIRQQEFNRGFLDQSDPLESAGTQLPDFSFSVSYPVDRVKQPELTNQLFGSVYGRVRAGSIPNADVQVVDFKDAKTGSRETARRYLVAETESVRQTHMRVYATFMTYGDYLYVSLSSFVLPPLSMWTAALAIAFVGFWSLVLLVALNVVGLLAAATLIALAFRPTIRSLSQGEPIGMALRRQFHKSHGLKTFDTDDILMFFKSTVPLALTSIQEVFEENGIPVDVLERAMQTVNNITTINTGGGSVQAIGSVIGGFAHRVSGGAVRRHG